jgi:hypothetical protein
MPLKNGTQKFLKLGPDFRRDDGWVAMTKKSAPKKEAPCFAISESSPEKLIF